MALDTVDKRFALIANNNEVLYPYKKAQRKTGRYGFALSAPSERDAYGGGLYTEDITEVVRKVVFDGWKARVMTTGRQDKQRNGSCMLNGNVVVGYWISDELKHLVKSAPTQPIELPRR